LKNVILSASGTGMAFLLLMLIHIPFLLHSERSGFGKEFRDQYTGFAKLLRNELVTEIQHIKNTLNHNRKDESKIQIANHIPDNSYSSPIPASSPLNQPQNQSVGIPTKEGKDGRLGRPDIRQIDKIERPRERAFALLIYYPAL
jgi:hypothetical protein